ncbi:L-threonylcarbamoyladenylate synthase [Thermoactinomyces mirandus]|nr:L-threonylcarbamoyladenylate synthase [Thermoactinomyces mirandus]
MDEFHLRQSEAVQKAASMLKEGKLVAFPTETVYGLGAIATSDESVARIFAAKGRPSDNPLIIHIGNKDQLFEWAAKVPEAARILMEKYMPGPITLVLPHRHNLAVNVTAGLPTVGIRMPDHPVALALLNEVGTPVAAPSANRSGKPSPTTAEHVWQDLAGRIDGILDGGPAGIGVESTVVDLSAEVPVLLRPGGITLEELRETLGEVNVDPGIRDQKQVPRSPGMKYRHYAPKGEMWLVKGDPQKMVLYIQKRVEEAKERGKRVGVLTTEENKEKYQADCVVAAGSRQDPTSVARHLYDALRHFDEQKVEMIFAESFQEQGLFYSVMNRMKKAASGKIVEV